MTKQDKKFEKLTSNEEFYGINVCEIYNRHSKEGYQNLYLYKGFPVCEGTSYPTFTRGELVNIGNLIIRTESSDDAKNLCEIILKICL